MNFYTTEGGTTEWTLPEGGLEIKVIYRLTDQVKKDVVELTVGADRQDSNYGDAKPTHMYFSKAAQGKKTMVWVKVCTR